MTKTTLKRGIQTVTVLFAAFQGFLPNMSPPEEILRSSAVGFASFLALFALFLTIALRKGVSTPAARRLWIASALALAISSGFVFNVYLKNLNRLTFEYPPGTESATLYVRGTELSEMAKRWKVENPNKSDSEMVFDFGGLPNKQRVWKEESIGKAKLLLTWNYILMVGALASSIFCLTEGVLAQPSSASRRRQPRVIERPAAADPGSQRSTTNEI